MAKIYMKSMHSLLDNNSEKINKYFFLSILSLVYFVSTISIGGFLFLISDNNRAGPTFVIVSLSIFLGLLIYFKNSSLASKFFTISLFILAGGTFIALIGYFSQSFSFLVFYGTPFLMIFPLFMFYSTRIIIDGETNWFDINALGITLLTCLVIIFTSVIGQSINYFELILISDLTISIFMVLIIFNFTQIQKLIPRIQKQIQIIIFGYIISIIGLISNLFYAINTNEGLISRHLLSMFGIFIVVIGFILIPQENRVLLLKGKIFKKKVLPKINQASKKLIESKSEETDINEEEVIKNDVLKIEDFQELLSSHINGISLNILLEIAIAYPKSTNFSFILSKLHKSKSTVSSNILKLKNLKLIEETINLIDTRVKPLKLTLKGEEFLNKLNNYGKIINLS